MSWGRKELSHQPKHRDVVRQPSSIEPISKANEVVSDSRVNEMYSTEHEYDGGADTDEDDRGGRRQDDHNVESENVAQQDYVDEQGIEEAMQDVDYYDNESDTLFASAATLKFLEDDITVEYTGVIKIFVAFYSESDELTAFVGFSTAEVPSLYTAAVTKESIVIHDGDTVTFPTPSEITSNCKAVFRFENEDLAETFYDTFLKMQLGDADATEYGEDPA